MSDKVRTPETAELPFEPDAETHGTVRSATERSGAPDDEEGMLPPLAERMRPRTIDEFVGQPQLVGERRLISRILAGSRLPSLILFGPPGTGKTTLARLLTRRMDAHFETLSATDAGVRELRSVVKQAQERRRHNGRDSVVFIDEIHRFNRGQQDALLPHVESGLFTLIGATTEHPSFQVNAALLSRVRVLELKELSEKDLVMILRRALEDSERGLGFANVGASDELLAALARAVGGDARRALNTLEIAVALTGGATRDLDAKIVDEALGEIGIRYDRAGEEHYNLASAFIKSMRASDPDAAVYWMARMLEGGEDPTFIGRRLVIFAAEDIGNAEPQALSVATAAMQAVQWIGMPEAVLPLSQATIFLSLAQKSNTAIKAYFAARKEIRATGALPVPLEVRNAVSKMMKQQGYGSGYRYPHDLGGVDRDHTSFLPEQLRNHLPGRRYVQRQNRGWEGRAESELEQRRFGTLRRNSRSRSEDEQT